MRQTSIMVLFASMLIDLNVLDADAWKLADGISDEPFQSEGKIIILENMRPVAFHLVAKAGLLPLLAGFGDQSRPVEQRHSPVYVDVVVAVSNPSFLRVSR